MNLTGAPDRRRPASSEGAVTSERQKMLAGKLYDPFDPELVAGRQAPARARIRQTHLDW
jgi:hypothetical protein